jgi:imidazolonepropionase-like amidohydrolase
MKKLKCFRLTIVVLVFLFIGCSSPALVQLSPPAKNGYLIRNVNVFTARSDQPVMENMDVLVQGEKIAAISKERLNETGLEIIEGKGMTIMPGLIDFHNHMMAGMIIPWKLDLLPPERFNREACLYSGIVAVVDMNGEDVGAMNKLASAIEEGKELSPRFYHCGMGFTAQGAHPIPMIDMVKTQLPWLMRVLFPKVVNEVKDETDMAEVEKHLAGNPDFTKIFLDDLPDGTPKMKAPVVKEIVRRSHNKGIPVLIHIGRNEDVKIAIESGADGIAHNVYKEPLDPQIAKGLAARKMFVIPTVYVFHKLNLFMNENNYQGYSKLERETIPPSHAEALCNPKPFPEGDAVWMEYYRNVKEKYKGVLHSNVKVLKDAKVTILAGTDTPNLGLATGGSLHTELVHLVEGGLTPTEALLSATSVPAAILRDVMHKNVNFGTVEVGKSADLLLVRGNPTKNISDTQNIAEVFYRGKRIIAKRDFDVTCKKP